MDTKKRKNKFELGTYAKDKYTGFSGIITAYCQYLSGDDRVCIEAKAKDGKPGEAEWFDVERVVTTTDVD